MTGQALMKQYLGPKCFDDGEGYVDHSSTLIQTRPYMRLMTALVKVSFEFQKRLTSASDHFAAVEEEAFVCEIGCLLYSCKINVIPTRLKSADAEGCWLSFCLTVAQGRRERKVPSQALLSGNCSHRSLEVHASNAITLEGLKTIVNILNDIADDLPVPASAIINLIQRALTTLDDIRSNRDECDLLQKRLLELLPVVMMALQRKRTRNTGKDELPDDLRQNIERLLSNLKNIDSEVAKIKDIVSSKRKRHRLTAVFWSKAHTATLQKCKDELDWAVRAFEVSSHLSDAVRLWEMSRKVERVLTNQFLEALPRAKYASFDCERPDKPSTCFEGTRTAILKLLTDWITDPDPSAPRFFWLNGIAGVGKTTVACTIAGLMQKLGLLGGQFCFSRRGEAELRNPALVFPTIAYQLARFDPEFGRRITTALEADPEAPFASLKEQLDRLIIKPLSGLERDPKRVVVLIFDAFDECEARGAKEILQLLIAAIPSLPFFLKVLVTSRPENHIRSVLVPAAHTLGAKLQMTALHDIETSIVKNDILLYLQDRLRRLPEELGLDLTPDWATDAEIELLAEKAGNLFIHAATSLRFLAKAWDLREQLDTLLTLMSSPHPASDSAQPFAELDQLYQQILLGIIPPGSGPQIPSRLRLILGSIVLLRDPLPVDCLERLVGLEPGKAINTLRHLYSVILTPPPPDDCPRVYHPSFPDFLQDPTRCPSNQIRIHTEEHEGRMALHCLNLLNSKLHKGMLGELDPILFNSEVDGLTNRVKNAFSPELQYACRYWASHLTNTSHADTAVKKALGFFASGSLLPWIEAMSWMEDTSLAIRCLETANAWLARSAGASETSTLINDGYRLLLAHKPTIAISAQHIVTSVIPFAPRHSIIASQYMAYVNSKVRVLRGVNPEWTACLMVWKGHHNTVKSIAYSPDGFRASSGSHDKSIRLWDTTTGGCTATLEGHTGWVNSVAFSSDGSALASGSLDTTLRVWDTTTGSCITVLEGHSGSVNSVAFSHDVPHIYSGSDDCTIRLWDLTTAMTIATFVGHSGGVKSVALSPNGENLASGSEDNTIRIWNLTGRCIAILKDHSAKVNSVTFSSSGSYLASGSEDSTVRIWDPDVWRCRHTFKGHSTSVNAVAFSADGTRLASSSLDMTIRIWDVATELIISTFPSSAVTSVAFHPDGARLISGSGDQTVRIWDTNLGHPTVTCEGHSHLITSMAFSQDGSRLVSSSWDKTARVWDAATGGHLMTLEGHSDHLQSIAFHPNGSHIATGSDDNTVRIWDTNTGDCIATLAGHSQPVTYLAFSSSGSHLMSRDWDENVLFWNVTQAEPVEGLDESQFEAPASSPFKINDGMLSRTLEGGSSQLVCILPPGTTVYLVVSFELGGGRDRVALGCWNGDLFILEIS